MNQSSLQDLTYRLTNALGSKALYVLDQIIARASLIGDDPVFNPDLFPWTRRLESHWPTIREELDSVLQYREALPNFQDISKDQASITDDDHWKTFFLYGYGEKAEENCARCPETTRLVESVPGMTTAFFSILSPGKHIPAHTGPYKGVLRYHLGLKVPEPSEQCRIRVADRQEHWEEGKSLLFDDTYEHEVWNETEGERAILFMDVKRPLRFPVSLLNRAILGLIRMSPFVQDAMRNQEQWTRRLEQAEAQSDRMKPTPEATQAA